MCTAATLLTKNHYFGRNLDLEYSYIETVAVTPRNYPFEFIPWILGQCATVAEAKKLLTKLNLLEEHYSAELPLSPLHWIIALRQT